jgi:pimeloyl-ACP methyl ester carboxylesterase
MNPSDTAWLAGVRALYVANGETEVTLQAINEGMGASGRALIDTSVAEDLPATATSFALPYYVIQGRHDLFSPTSLVEAYFEKVSAPKKRLVIIEDAGHFALVTHQAQMIAALTAMIP